MTTSEALALRPGIDRVTRREVNGPVCDVLEHRNVNGRAAVILRRNGQEFSKYADEMGTWDIAVPVSEVIQ